MQVDGKASVNQRIAGAFKAASDTTGTSFDYLLSTAGRESDVRPDLEAKTSTAKGLFQFVDQTWFGLIKNEGPSVGLNRLADQITSDGKGGWTVADPTEKAKILSLKTDPLVSSVMAGKFTESNRAQLSDSLGRAPTDGELYAAHVLGASGAAKLVRMSQTEPGTTAAVAFPKAAAANSGLFYGKDGKPRTAAELLTDLTRSTDSQASESTSRIAEAHVALTAANKARTDPNTVALLLRAQATALVSKEATGAGAGASGQEAASQYVRTALSATSIPGAQSGTEPPRGAAIEGWRAKSASDAFSSLMRSDGATSSEADAATALADPTALPTGARPTGALLAATGRKAGGGAGGVPYLDPNAPMDLSASHAANEAVVLPAGARASRLVTQASTGGPDMPLPMVDAARGATRPSRLLFSSTDTSASATGDVGAAPGAVRVRTTSIAAPTTVATAPVATSATPSAAPATTSTVAATAEGAATAATQTTAAAPRRAARTPLDLNALARGRTGVSR